MTSQIPDPNQDPQRGAQPGAEQPPAQPVPPVQPPPVPPVQPPAQPAQPAASTEEQAISTLTLNFWLSVFFAFIPALIFYFIEKGKNARVDEFNRENLNFSLIRTGLVVISMFFSWIPVLGWLIWIVALLGGLVLFVFHLIAAAKVQENYRSGGKPGFIFNIPFIK